MLRQKILMIKYLILLTQLLLVLLLLLKIKYIVLAIQSKKTDCNTKVNEIENKITTDHDHDKYFTTQQFSKLTSENFTARLSQANLARRSDIANYVKKANLNKDELNELTKKLK